MTYITNFEVNFLFYLQEHVRTEWLTYIMKFFSFLGDAGILAIITCFVLLIIKKTRVTGITASLSLVINTIIVNIIIKPLAARPRPYDTFENLTILVRPLRDYSFPSGHSSASFAVAAVMLMLMPKKYGIPAVIVASLIAFSRLYVGVHYPTDVLTGILIGFITALIAKQICSKFFKPDFT